VSPDGGLVATGGFDLPGGAKVWEAQSGKLVKHLPVGASCRVAFSPDGKRLLTGVGNGQIRVWEVGTWTEVLIQEPLRGVAFAFSPDGKLLAAETGAGVARLLDPDTGKEYARLEDPNQHVSLHFRFSADRSKLVCASRHGYCLHIWDLQALRRQLAAMRLDWQG
jgi:WD40 repeat protein